MQAIGFAGNLTGGDDAAQAILTFADHHIMLHVDPAADAIAYRNRCSRGEGRQALSRQYKLELVAGSEPLEAEANLIHTFTERAP